MIPSRDELLRRRRCRLLVVGMILGALLPVFQWSWITLGIGVAGIVALAVVYRRDCRHTAAQEPARNDTDTRASGP